MASLPRPPPATSVERVLPAPSAPRRTESMLFLLCGAVSVLGAYLPWATVSASFIDTVRTVGIDGDGRLTLVLGVGAVAVGAASLVRPARRPGLGVIGLLLASALTGVALVNVAGFRSAAGPLSAEARTLVDLSIGSGLWLTLVAGVAGVAGGVVAVLLPDSGGAIAPRPSYVIETDGNAVFRSR